MFNQLCKDLENSGIKAGMVLMVHSSYKALGMSGYNPKIVIEALQNVLTSDGTLLMPSLTYSTVTPQNPRFSYHNTPVCVGIIPETFRKSHGVIRSFNPVHSVCAWGRFAAEITKNHKFDSISIGENSPYRLLPSYRGKILMLGCGLKPNTFMHGVENVAKLPYREIKHIVKYTMEDENGTISTYSGGVGDMSQYIQRYDRVADVLSPPHLVTTQILDATAHIIDADALMKEGLKVLASEPYYFVDNCKTL